MHNEKIIKGEKMNISSNYSNKPAFGMAFKKPNQHVMDYFKGVVEKMMPSERQQFVKNINSVVEGAKNCPVEIEHSLWTKEGESAVRYMSIVGGKKIYGASDIKHPEREIISAMNQASEKARDIQNANECVEKIGKLFEA